MHEQTGIDQSSNFVPLKFLSTYYQDQYQRILSELNKKNPTNSPSLSLLAHQIAQLVVLQMVINDVEFRQTRPNAEGETKHFPRLQTQVDNIKRTLGGPSYSGLTHTAKIKEITLEYAKATDLKQREVSRMHRFVTRGIEVILKYLPKEFDTPGGPVEKIKANLEKLIEETLS